MGFPGGSAVKNLPASAGDMGLIPRLGKIPRIKKWQSTPLLLPGKSHGWRSLAGYSAWSHKELDMTWWLSTYMCVCVCVCVCIYASFPDGSVVKNPPTSAGDVGLISESGRSPGGGNGNLLQYSCLGPRQDRGAWQTTVHEVTKSWTWLGDLTPFISLKFGNHVMLVQLLTWLDNRRCRKLK